MEQSSIQKMAVFCVSTSTFGSPTWVLRSDFLATAFEGVRGRLFPTVGMVSFHGIRICANFGQQKDVPFRYQA